MRGTSGFSILFILCMLKFFHAGTSLAVQWLRLHASNAGGTGSIPGWGTKIPHPTCCGLKNKKKPKIFSMLKKGFFCFLIEAPLHLRVFMTFSFWRPQEVTIPNKRYLPKETPSHCHPCCPHLHPCNRELQQPYCSSIRKARGISRIFYSHFPFLKR